MTYMQEYYKQKKELVLSTNKRYYEINRDKISKRNSYTHHIRYVKKKKQLMSILIDNKPFSCAHCGYDTDFWALDFDHIHNNGSIDRKRFRNNEHMFVYYISHPEEAKQQLQILCANCNWIKEAERVRNKREGKYIK